MPKSDSEATSPQLHMLQRIKPSRGSLTSWSVRITTSHLISPCYSIRLFLLVRCKYGLVAASRQLAEQAGSGQIPAYMAADLIPIKHVR